MVTLIHGERGALYDVTEPTDAECGSTGILNIDLDPWEQVESRFFKYSII